MMKKNRVLRAVCLVMALCVLLSGCSSSPTIVKVDGKGISQGEYAYYYGYLGATYLMYGIEADPATLEEYAEGQIKNMIAIQKLAKEYGLKLTAEENKTFLDNKASEISSMGGRTVYTNLLKGLGLSESKYNELGRNALLYQKIASYLYSENGVETPTEEELRAEYLKSYIHVTHILISTGEAETDEDRKALREKAEEALERANAGEDFAELIREYGEDPGVADTPEEGYYFTTGQMDAAFESASYALAEGEISEIVDSSYGHHIILRLPMEDDYVNNAIYGDFYNSYATALLGEKLYAFTENMTIEKTSAFAKANLDDASMAWAIMFSAMDAASGY